jgi:hypothetical protein
MRPEKVQRIEEVKDKIRSEIERMMKKKLSKAIQNP